MASDDRFAQGSWQQARRWLAGTRSEIVTGPVGDWAADFSLSTRRGPPTRTRSRMICGSAARSRTAQRFGGAWLPTRYEDVAAIACGTSCFSLQAIIVEDNVRPSPDLAPAGGSPPITSDPPFQPSPRRLLLPAFTPTAMKKRERPRSSCATR